MSSTPPFRCGTAASRRAIARLLDLPEPTLLDQDWEICSADAIRLEEFVCRYDSLSDSDERFTLMEIIIASLDDAIGNGAPSAALATPIRMRLQQEFPLHAFSIHYWCLWDRGPNPPADQIFFVTPLMREIWSEAERNIR